MKNLNFGLFISYFCANLNLQRCIQYITYNASYLFRICTNSFICCLDHSKQSQGTPCFFSSFWAYVDTTWRVWMLALFTSSVRQYGHFMCACPKRYTAFLLICISQHFPQNVCPHEVSIWGFTVSPGCITIRFSHFPFI